MAIALNTADAICRPSSVGRAYELYNNEFQGRRPSGFAAFLLWFPVAFGVGFAGCGEFYLGGGSAVWVAGKFVVESDGGGADGDAFKYGYQQFALFFFGELVDLCPGEGDVLPVGRFGGLVGEFGQAFFTGVAASFDLLAFFFGVGEVDNAFGDGVDEALFLFLQAVEFGVDGFDLLGGGVGAVVVDPVGFDLIEALEGVGDVGEHELVDDALGDHAFLARGL